jgi:chemotaxis protein MotA
MPTVDEPEPRLLARARLIAVAAGFIVVLGAIAISAGGLLSFLNPGGLIVVVGGVIAAAFVSFETEDVCKALRSIMLTLSGSQPTPRDLLQDIDDIIGWSRLVNQYGTRGLEQVVRKTSLEDAFVGYGLNLVVSDYSPDEVRTMMLRAADASYDRHCVPVDVLRAMTSHAPAFGMIGTLVGMVAMLHDLSYNVSSIGAALAIAFLSTLYGVVSARLIYMPAAARLQQEVDADQARHALITEGMVMLACKKSPMHIRDSLNGFLRPEAYNFFNVVTDDTVRDPRDRSIAGTVGRTGSELAVRQLKVVRT